ncbi:unnamed protein product [Hermetia illucens]|uniref:MD-2-related lipid-recognition domain-containing protein n=1 Tax=Hermetia illucens TaxID=343691 RepID=A0A7R8V2T2_HERIL|nr:uncharacterized protein LOC119657951 [Hermetia illucens]CAD7091718.1 unnamed protein product [Hermetia illucens]
MAVVEKLFRAGLALVILCFYTVQAIKDVNIKELNCDYNSERVNNVTCKILETGVRRHMDFSVTLLKDVVDVIAHVEIIKNDGGRLIPLVNITDDFCKFMAGSSSSFYLDLLMKMLRDQSNINHACPYKGYLYATGINPDPQLIPSGIPVGEYIFNIRLYEYKPENFLGKIKAVVDFL